VPKVSIIMPAYNARRTITESIESILAQTFPDWELIICDDASTDDTVAVVSPYLSDTRIRLLRSTENSGGASRPRNRAIAQASGSWLAFLDADNLWLPLKLEKQLNYLHQHSEVVLVHSNYRHLQNGRLRRMRYLPTRKCEVAGNVYDRLIWRNSVETSTVVLNPEVLSRTGLFDEQLTMVEDHDMWIRVAQQGLFGYLYEPLMIYRTHSGTGFRSAENLHQVERSMLLISDRYTQDNFKARARSLARVYGVMGLLYLENDNKPVAREKLKLALYYASAAFDPYVLLVLKLLLQAAW
jgi:glycosyltransferase involved in cell wall biosynthesis